MRAPARRIERPVRRGAAARLVANAAAVAAVLALLAGCGQRGPLYLPDSQPKKKLAAGPQAPAPAPAPLQH
ncbi:MAG: lipoprotein [Burkholderiaceae bacterium]|nr:lipoprotein [Burkholderiaceae bacterium]